MNGFKRFMSYSTQNGTQAILSAANHVAPAQKNYNKSRRYRAQGSGDARMKHRTEETMSFPSVQLSGVGKSEPKTAFEFCTWLTGVKTQRAAVTP